MFWRRHLLAVSTLFVTVLILGGLTLSQPAQGAEVNGLLSWVDGTPEIKKQNDLTIDAFQKRSQSPSCEYQTVHEWGYNSGWGPKLQYSLQGCTVPIQSGTYDLSNKAIIANGSDQLQRLKDPLGDDLRQIYTIAAPNTNKLAMVYDSYYPFNNGGAKLKLVDDMAQTFQPSLTIDGYANVERIRSTPFDYELKDTAGNYVEIRTEGLKYSPNGKWLQVLLRDKSHVLLNTDTHAIIPYSDATESSWAVHDSVANNGHYVAITSQQNSLKIYDLQQCNAASGEFVSRNCRSIEMYDRIHEFIGAGSQVNIGNVEFVGVGDALDVDISTSADGTNWQYETLRLNVPGRQPQKYLALGDSFSSGEGAYDYRSPTDFYIDDTNYNLCHQSTNSYPYLLQSTEQFDWFHSVACSGAIMDNVKYSKDASRYLNDHKSQAKTLLPSDQSTIRNFVENFAPGYIPQSEYVNEYAPSILTISIGGNDIGFRDIITSCIINKGLNQTCFWDRDEREAQANEIDQKISHLSIIFADIKNTMSGSNPKLYVIGYPKIFDPDGFCGLNVPFQRSEIEAANNLTDYLNAAIKVAADAAGVRFVDINDAFIGSTDTRLCSPGSLAVNALDMRSLVSQCPSNARPNEMACFESFHPNQLGHSLMANAIRSWTADMTLDMPEPKNSMTNLLDKREAFVGDVAITQQNYRITYQKDIAPQLTTVGTQLRVSVAKDEDDLPARAGTSATITVHSTPREIGSLPISSDGSVVGNITLPHDLSVGYHQIHVSYFDIAGNTIDKYGYFYAAASNDDWDGDGIKNQTDPCSLIMQSNTDHDEDGNDDACDNEYRNLPKPTDDNSQDESSNGKVNGTSAISFQPRGQSLNGQLHQSDVAISSSLLANTATVPALSNIFDEKAVVPELRIEKQNPNKDNLNLRPTSSIQAAKSNEELPSYPFLVSAGIIAAVLLALYVKRKN